MTLESRKFTGQLHVCIQELVGMGIFRYQNSCLLEVLDNALARFASMGLCEATVFESQANGRVVYIRVPKKEK